MICELPCNAVPADALPKGCDGPYAGAKVPAQLTPGMNGGAKWVAHRFGRVPATPGCSWLTDSRFLYTAKSGQTYANLMFRG
ncbi:MAG: hypothetical protein H6964_03000 [Chromatiaceae bacterium]|nr:hypothetical protein [Chromatiaceae bacterium]